jgi:hypothetical protein
MKYHVTEIHVRYAYADPMGVLHHDPVALGRVRRLVAGK